MNRNLIVTAVLALGTMVAAQETAQADFRIGIHTPNVDIRFGSGGHSHGHHHGLPAYYGGYRPVPIYVPSYYTPAPVVVTPAYNTYTVEYRAFAHEPWRVYAVTYSHGEAHRLENRLESLGYRARIRH